LFTRRTDVSKVLQPANRRIFSSSSGVWTTLSRAETVVVGIVFEEGVAV
jgi:hypothetical protein